MPDGSLYFVRVTRNRKRTDAGVYQCVASNKHGTVYSKNASLTVGSKCSFMTSVFDDDDDDDDGKCLPWVQ